MSNLRTELFEMLSEVNSSNFDELANIIYNYQKKENKIFQNFSTNFSNSTQYNFLPISAFKFLPVVSGNWHPTSFFESSGTTSTINSKLYIQDINFYLQNTVAGFNYHYGNPSDYCILALLPHYLERSHSSLVAMVKHLIDCSSYSQSGFFLHDHEALFHVLVKNQKDKIPTILFGVSFGLLDFTEKHQIIYPDLIVMETGGMKGRKEDITKEKLHGILCNAFGTSNVHSEYGMTELYSQAYSKGKGIFFPSPTLKIVITEITDPLTKEKYGKTGVINVIDLANIDTCSFIATEDLGIAFEDGSFMVQGRMQSSDLRGCNLMLSDI
jgi:hypothetical protein